ncbi:MAG: hypothetical protein V1859_08310 [archaeon]
MAQDLLKSLYSNMDKITIKVYGKVLVFGAYSILETGNVGLVMNVNKGTAANVTKEKKGIKIILDDYNIKEHAIYAKGKIILKSKYKYLLFAKNAILYSLKYLELKKIKHQAFSIRTKNDKEMNPGGIKAGLGSSASSTTAIVASILSLHGIDVFSKKGRMVVFKIAYYAHFISQGKNGSGFDIAACCFGSSFFVKQNYELSSFENFIKSKIDLKFKEFIWPSSLKTSLIFAKCPAKTPCLVKKVFVFQKKERKEYDLFMSGYNAINKQLETAFIKKDNEKIKLLLVKSWEKRKELGILCKSNIQPKNADKIISNFNKKGFVAGLVGAGAGDSYLVISYKKGINLKNQKLKLISKPYHKK